MGWQDAPVVSESAQPAWMSAPEVAPKKPQQQEPQPSFGQNLLQGAKHVGNEVVRAGAHLVTGLPLMAADAATAVGALAQGRTSLKPGEKFPSQQYEETLSNAFPAPTTTAGKVSEGASELIGGGLASAGRRAAGLLTKTEAEAAPIAKAAEAQRAAVKAAEKAPDNAKLANARQWGFKVMPSEGGAGLAGRAAQGMSGKLQTEYALSRSNAVQADKLAGKAIGLADTQPMTEGNIERLKRGAYRVYDQVKSQGRIITDDDYRKELDAVRDRTQQAAADFPEDFNEQLDKEIKKFSVSSADSSSFLEKIKSLRQRAGKNMSSLDNDTFELGLAQKKIATAMENQIERATATSNPALVSQFRQARTQLAKIYNVEEALSPSGHVSAAVLARQLKRDVPLSGELKAIAQNFMEFPKNMRHPDSMGGTNTPFSALDYLVGGVEAALNPHKAGAVLGALALRPAARKAITSNAYQKLLQLQGSHAKPKTHTLEDLTIGAAAASPSQGKD